MNLHSSSIRRIRKIVVALALVMSLNLPTPGLSPRVSAQGSAAPQPDETGPIGLVSNALDCLAINSDSGVSTGTIWFEWTGQAQGARLVLNVADAEIGQPVMVNGQLVGHVPASLAGESCSQGQAVYLDFESTILEQGENTIEIGDAGQPGDAWTAANVRLEVFGQVQPGAGEPHTPSQAQAPAMVSSIVSFNNHRDGSNQQAVVQVPDGYSNANPVPLVIYAHSRYGDMEEGGDILGVAANARGWLLASPQLHGHWPTPPNPPGAFAYASLESQYDILGTVQYLLSHSAYNVDRNRIYLVGYSMGGQIAVVTGAKYPDVFAAVFDNKGPTDFSQWYVEQSALPGHTQQVTAMAQECYTGSSSSPTPKPPAGNQFCYHRRSGVEFARNLIHVPISITHSFDDIEVPITHSLDLRNAINSFGPDRTAAVYVDTVDGPTCGPYYHCYEPNSNAVLTFLNSFTLHNSQSHLNLVSDESKAYYWLKFAETGSEHWSYIEAAANGAQRSVTLSITDAKSLTIGVNLGSSPIQDWAGLSHPGLGYPAGTYHVQGVGLDTDIAYSSGYLQFTVPPTTQGTVTIELTAFIAHQLFMPLLLH